MYHDDPSLVRAQVCVGTSSLPADAPCPECVFMLNTFDQPLRGGQCDVYALKNHSGKAVCVRVYRDPGQASMYLVENEIRYRKAIEEHEIRHFQSMLSYCSHKNTWIGAPYVSLTWAFGEPLRWTQTHPAVTSDREKINASCGSIYCGFTQDTKKRFAATYAYHVSRSLLKHEFSRKICQRIHGCKDTTQD